MKEFFNSKLIKPLLGFIKTGTSPTKLALGMAWGIVLGIIPLIGINTLLCILVAFVFKINMGVVQLVNYFVYPLQLILFIPFIKVGIYLFGKNTLSYPLEDIWDRLQVNFIETLGDIWMVNLFGIFIWLAISPLLYQLTYMGSKYLINRVYKEEKDKEK